MTFNREGLARSCEFVMAGVRAWSRAVDARRTRFAMVGSASPASIDQYRAIYRHIELRRRTTGLSASGCAAATGCRATWRQARAAYFYCARQRMQALVETLERRLPPTAHLETPDDHRELEALFDALLDQLCAVHSFASGIKARHDRARKTCIEGLPADWREQLAQRVPAGLRRAYLVMALTGCRPIELARGIDVRLGRERQWDVLRLTIRGAKLSAHSGQPLRSVCWPVHANTLTTLLCNELADVEPGPDGSQCARIEFTERNSLRMWLRHHGARLWPGRTLFPYALRYQFATDLEAARLGSAQIAKALGHCVGHTQTRYRPRRRPTAVPRGPALALGQIEASRPVRERTRQRERECEPERQLGD